MRKRTSNNINDIVDKGSFVGIWIAGESISVKQERNYIPQSREMVYPPKGELDWRHPWTGEQMKSYRDGYIVPLAYTDPMFIKMCLQWFNSMKKRVKGNYLTDRREPLARIDKCSMANATPFVCLFSKQPTFRIRGLCKEAVMDTQYKLADHSPGSHSYGSMDYRSFVGPKGWIISRNRTDKKGRMSHYFYTDLTLTMLDHDALPVGRHKWLVENNACKEGKTSAEILQLSACEEDQFTCHDGKCLNINQRCNNIEVRLYYVSRPH